MAPPAHARLAGVVGAALIMAGAVVLAFAWIALAAPPAPAADGDIPISLSVPPAASSTSLGPGENPLDDPTFSTTPPTKASSTPPAPTPTTTATTPTSGSTPGRTSGGSSASAPPGGSAPGGATAAPCAESEPPIPLTPAEGAWAAAVDKDIYLPGHKVTATASRFGPGEHVQLVLFSDPHLIGNFTASEDGEVQAVFAVADDAAPGTHTIQFTGWCGQVTSRADVLVGSPGAAPAESAWPWWWWLVLVLALLTGLFFLIRQRLRRRRELAAGAGAVAA
ncbi:MAG: hypothetical protein LBD51_00925 [Bifidobacteriaceae bacterium]|nr:hypothetical protein [Bifidobacteriaceae bacterium]